MMLLVLLLGCPLVTESDLAGVRDFDGDGFASEQFGGKDCDDADPDVNPAAENEWYTGVREDCAEGTDFDQDGDGFDRDDDCDDTDPTATTPREWFPDNDGDGLGNPAYSLDSCSRPEGAVPIATDCNDNVRTIGSSIEFFGDADGDGFGDPDNRTGACEPPTGYVLDATDCDDDDPDAHPGAVWYFDSDGDGFGDPLTATPSCGPPDLDGWVADGTDCDDDQGGVYPGAPGEAWKDGIDTDCGGDTDLDGDGDTLPDIPGCAPGTLIRVPADFPDLLTALDAASACDVIELDAGDWGRVDIDKSIAITAAPHTRPRIVAAPVDGLGISIDSDLSVVLEGLVIDGFDKAILVKGRSGLLAADLEIREGLGIEAEAQTMLELYDIVWRNGIKALANHSGTLTLHRCEIEAALSPTDVVSLGRGVVDIQGCTIRDSAAGAGALLYSEAEDLSLSGLRLEGNLGVALDLVPPDPLTEVSWQLVDVTLRDNTSTAPFLARAAGALLGSFSAHGLVVRDNNWGTPPGLSEDPTIQQALFLVERLQTTIERAQFRGNLMNRDGPQLQVTSYTAVGVPLAVRATEISGSDGIGVRMDGGVLENVTLVGMGLAISAAGPVSIDSSIVCNNGEVTDSPSLTANRTLFWSNGGNDSTSGVGNLNLNPAFLRYHPNLPHDVWDLRLLQTSPGVGVGAWGDLGAYGGPAADPDAMLDYEPDGMYDTWELEWFGDVAAQPGQDPDADSRTNLQEFRDGTLPMHVDTDGDGVSDDTDRCPLDVEEAYALECPAWRPGVLRP